MFNDDLTTISWKDLTGNRFNKGLHPVMLSKEGYLRPTKVKIINSIEPNYYKVRYDRSYVIAYLVCKLFKPLSEVNRAELFRLLSEAYALSKIRNTK